MQVVFYTSDEPSAATGIQVNAVGRHFVCKCCALESQCCEATFGGITFERLQLGIRVISAVPYTILVATRDVLSLCFGDM